MLVARLRTHSGPDGPKNAYFRPARRFSVGYVIDDLLRYAVMISTLFSLGIWWHVVQTVPGLLESVGYVYGILIASCSLEALYTYLESDLD
jgi:hypothetical protein